VRNRKQIFGRVDGRLRKMSEANAKGIDCHRERPEPDIGVAPWSLALTLLRL